VEIGFVFSDKILGNIVKTGLFLTFNKSKIIALCFLAISLIGVKGKKQEKLSVKTGLIYIGTGRLIYFVCGLMLYINVSTKVLSILYGCTASFGFNRWDACLSGNLPEY
jgi:hypothetical protein